MFEKYKKNGARGRIEGVLQPWEAKRGRDNLGRDNLSPLSLSLLLPSFFPPTFSFFSIALPLSSLPHFILYFSLLFFSVPLSPTSSISVSPSLFSIALLLSPSLPPSLCLSLSHTHFPEASLYTK
jgi:hypothetical protein